MSVETPHSDAEPFLKGAAASQGLFTIPSRAWNTTNLSFLHNVAGKEVKENPHRPHNEQPNRFPVPIEQVPDLTDFVYGEMPQALTLRPQEQTGCCNCDFKFDVARDMFADAAAEVTIQFPKMICCFLAGMQTAPIEVTPKSGTTGVTYKGVLKRTFLPGCLGNDTTIVWEETQGKPEMKILVGASSDPESIDLSTLIWNPH